MKAIDDEVLKEIYDMLENFDAKSSDERVELLKKLFLKGYEKGRNLKNRKINLDDEGFYTPQEIMTIFKITYPTFLKYVKEGKINAVRLGRLWRIEENELRRILREGLS